MVSVMSLWLPILLSAVFVFVASSLVHMVLPYHRSDVGAVPSEDQVADAIRNAGVGPGNYVIPHAGSPAAMKDPAWIEKRKRGPVLYMAVSIPGQGMGLQLFQWFVYAIVVAIFAAYITGRALGPGAEYMEVFRFSSAATFMAYGLGTWSESIWWSRNWSASVKNTVDALIYALLTGGAFGWLWPAM